MLNMHSKKINLATGKDVTWTEDMDRKKINRTA